MAAAFEPFPASSVSAVKLLLMAIPVRSDSFPAGGMVLENNMKIFAAAALVFAVILSSAPADARTCANSHGKNFHCHRLLKPRINFHKKHPIKILRCRAHHGKLNKC